MSIQDRIASFVTRSGSPSTPGTDIELRRTGTLQPISQPQVYPSSPRADQGLIKINFNQYNNAAAYIQQWYYGDLWVYRGINTIASAVAALPWRVGSNPDRPESYNRFAPMAQLLGPEPGSPNPEMSSASLWKFSVISYLVTGVMAWEKVRDALGRVVAYWPLQTPALKPLYAESGDSYIAGFEYGFGAAKRTLSRQNVMYVYRPRLDDPRRPESLLEAAGMVIETDKMLHVQDYNTLARGGPMILVEHDPIPSDEQYDAFKADFIQNFTGSGNAGKPMFVERRISGDDGSSTPSTAIHPTGWSPKDMMFGEQKKLGKEDILASIGVPVSIIGVTGEVTYQNGGWDRRNFWQETVKPIIDALVDGVNAETKGDYVREQSGWFDVTDVAELRPIPPLTPEQAAVALDKKAITVDEYREFIGLEPLPPEAVPTPVQTPAAPAQDAAAATTTVDPTTVVPPVTPFAQARRERRAKVLFASPAACDICMAFDGKGRGRYKYLLPHPNCNCDIEDLRARHLLREAMVTQDAMLFGEMAKAMQAIKDGSRGAKLQAQFRSDPLSLLDRDKWERRADEVYRGNLLQLGHWDDYQEVANERLECIIENLHEQGLLTPDSEGISS